MKKSFAIVLGLALLTACSETAQDTKVEEIEQEVISEKESVNVIPNHILTMEVSGMSCEMACGGAIREGLIETGAVARVQYIDFDMDQETNIAKVYFDDSKISEENIIEIVSTLNKKQFTVGKRRTDEYSEPTSSVKIQESHSSNSKPTAVSVNTSVVELPNLFDLLRSIVHN